jgi:fructose-1,6-bisphosphatase/inositol monophosphatase family enzyme
MTPWKKRLADALLALLPGSVLVGEESASADAALFELLRGDAPVWLVDPLDGTANFAAGSPVFGTMVCLVHRGATAPPDSPADDRAAPGRVRLRSVAGWQAAANRASCRAVAGATGTKFFPRR